MRNMKSTYEIVSGVRWASDLGGSGQYMCRLLDERVNSKVIKTPFVPICQFLILQEF